MMFCAGGTLPLVGNENLSVRESSCYGGTEIYRAIPFHRNRYEALPARTLTGCLQDSKSQNVVLTTSEWCLDNIRSNGWETAAALRNKQKM